MSLGSSLLESPPETAVHFYDFDHKDTIFCQSFSNDKSYHRFPHASNAMFFPVHCKPRGILHASSNGFHYFQETDLGDIRKIKSRFCSYLR